MIKTAILFILTLVFSFIFIFVFSEILYFVFNGPDGSNRGPDIIVFLPIILGPIVAFLLAKLILIKLNKPPNQEDPGDSVSPPQI